MINRKGTTSNLFYSRNIRRGNLQTTSPLFKKMQNLLTSSEIKRRRSSQFDAMKMREQGGHYIQFTITFDNQGPSLDDL